MLTADGESILKDEPVLAGLPVALSWRADVTPTQPLCHTRNDRNIRTIANPLLIQCLLGATVGLPPPATILSLPGSLSDVLGSIQRECSAVNWTEVLRTH